MLNKRMSLACLIQKRVREEERKGKKQECQKIKENLNKTHKMDLEFLSFTSMRKEKDESTGQREEWKRIKV